MESSFIHVKNSSLFVSILPQKKDTVNANVQKLATNYATSSLLAHVDELIMNE